MFRRLSVMNLRRDDFTREILFRGRWYTEEEYLELRESMAQDEYDYDCAMESRAEARAEMEEEESWAA